jgi:hypothetical protein
VQEEKLQYAPPEHMTKFSHGCDISASHLLLNLISYHGDSGDYRWKDTEDFGCANVL